MVKQNAGASKEAVALAIVDGDVVAVDLGHAVGTARMKRRRFSLRRLASAAKHLAAAGLIETCLRTNLSNCIEQSSHAKRRELRRENRLLPTRRHERHGR